MHLACTMGNVSITKILLDHGADANQWDTAKKLTPLHCAARVGSAECIQQLLKRGAQVNAGIEKRSAIHFAIEKNAIKCVEILLKYGANPNTPQVKKISCTTRFILFKNNSILGLHRNTSSYRCRIRS